MEKINQKMPLFLLSMMMTIGFLVMIICIIFILREHSIETH